jgi:hypothetical protein
MIVVYKIYNHQYAQDGATKTSNPLSYLEGRLADEEFGALLVLADLAESDSSRTVAMRSM